MPAPEVVKDSWDKRRPMLLLCDYEMAQPGRNVIEARLASGCFCGSHAAGLVQRQNAAGATLVTLQCVNCGSSIGGPLRREHHPNWRDLPRWDDELRERFNQRRAAEAFEELREKNDARRAAAQEFYATERWRWMRDAVLARAGHICEACRARPAVTAHHLTYVFGLDAPLYTLRALCGGCHERMHTQGDAWHDPALPAHRHVTQEWWQE